MNSHGKRIKKKIMFVIEHLWVPIIFVQCVFHTIPANIQRASVAAVSEELTLVPLPFFFTFLSVPSQKCAAPRQSLFGESSFLRNFPSVSWLHPGGPQKGMRFITSGHCLKLYFPVCLLANKQTRALAPAEWVARGKNLTEKRREWRKTWVFCT